MARSGDPGDTSLTTLAVGGGSLALLLAMRYLRPKWPRALMVVVLAIAAIAGARSVRTRGRRHGRRPDRAVRGRACPDVGSSDLGALIVGALSVVFVGYSETLAAGRAMAASSTATRSTPTRS